MLKVPHHGSHEFVPEMLRKAAPVVTEMVAYFAPLKDAFQRLPKKKERELRNAFDKSSFGIVNVRTDEKRVLVATHSGQDKSK